MLQEAEGAGRGGEGEEEGRADQEARAEAAGEGGAEEPEEGEAAAGGGAEEAPDEDRHGGEETAAGSAQFRIDPAHRRAAGQGQGTPAHTAHTAQDVAAFRGSVLVLSIWDSHSVGQVDRMIR